MCVEEREDDRSMSPRVDGNEMLKVKQTDTLRSGGDKTPKTKQPQSVLHMSTQP